MRLHRLSLVNFKNIAAAAPEFSEGLNCFVGENGAGKTNVLDALHYLSTGRSALGMTDRQSVRHGEDFFVTEGEYTTDEGRGLNISCSFSATSGKKLRADGKEYERLSDHVGVVPMVMVSPADAFLVSDVAAERRRWLDAFVSGLDREYLIALVRYNAVLAERNRLLKSGYSATADEILDVLDMQLTAHGEKIHARRAEIIARMQPVVAQYYAHLADDRETVEMSYRSEPSLAPREKDFANGFTTAGVHRDDVGMHIGGHQLRKYGSQGQQKSFLIALKLAQYVLLGEGVGQRPILLLDDLFDKLDTGRVERLLGLVADPAFGQIFISDCNVERLEDVLRRGECTYALFELKNGNVEQLVIHN